MSFDALADAWLTGSLTMFVEVVLLKGSVLLGVGFVVTWLLRRGSAAQRHAVWAAVMIGLLLVPVVRVAGSWWTEGQGIAAPAVRATPEEVLDASMAAPGPGMLAVAAEVQRPFPPDPATDSAPITLDLGSWGRWLVWVWFGGTGSLLLRFAFGLGWARRVRHDAAPAPPPLARRAARMSAALGLRRPSAVLVSDRLRVPGMFGLLRPVVVLPGDAGKWTDEEMDAALVHELTHVQRRDYWMLFAAQLARAFYWLNPLVWRAERALARERERACDDGAIGGRIDPIRYAEQLVRFAARHRVLVRPTTPLLQLAGRSSFGHRLRAVLDGSLCRTPATRRWLGTLSVLTALTVLPIATIEVLGVQQRPDAVRVQLERLTNPDPITRRRAAWALGELEHHDAVDALIAALNEDDHRVRTAAAWALGEIKDRRAGAALLRAVEDAHPRVREMAVLALGELRAPEWIGGLEPLASRDGLRAAAAWALDEIAGTAPQVWAGSLDRAPAEPGQLATYLEVLRQGDVSARARAAEQLGRLGDPAAVEALLDALEDPAPAVRARAVWALDEINPSRDGSAGTRSHPARS